MSVWRAERDKVRTARLPDGPKKPTYLPLARLPLDRLPRRQRDRGGRRCVRCTRQCASSQCYQRSSAASIGESTCRAAAGGRRSSTSRPPSSSLLSPTRTPPRSVTGCRVPIPSFRVCSIAETQRGCGNRARTSCGAKHRKLRWRRCSRASKRFSRALRRQRGPPPTDGSGKKCWFIS